MVSVNSEPNPKTRNCLCVQKKCIYLKRNELSTCFSMNRIFIGKTLTAAAARARSALDASPAAVLYPQGQKTIGQTTNLLVFFIKRLSDAWEATGEQWNRKSARGGGFYQKEVGFPT
jgi:hypothetical protein